MVCKSDRLDPPMFPSFALNLSSGIWIPFSPHIFNKSSMEWLELQQIKV